MIIPKILKNMSKNKFPFKLFFFIPFIFSIFILSRGENAQPPLEQSLVYYPDSYVVREDHKQIERNQILSKVDVLDSYGVKKDTFYLVKSNLNDQDLTKYTVISSAETFEMHFFKEFYMRNRKSSRSSKLNKEINIYEAQAKYQQILEGEIVDSIRNSDEIIVLFEYFDGNYHYQMYIDSNFLNFFENQYQYDVGPILFVRNYPHIETSFLGYIAFSNLSYPEIRYKMINTLNYLELATFPESTIKFFKKIQ